MEYSSRIKVAVKNVKDWEGIKNVDFEYYDLKYSYKYFKNYKSKEFYIDMEWSSDEDELVSLVYEISESMSGKCVIVADTNNIDVDSYKFCFYYFGTTVKQYYVPEKHWQKVEKIDCCDIRDIAKWINVTKIKLSNEEIEYLKDFNIEYDEKLKKYIDRAEEERRKKEKEEKQRKEKEEREKQKEAAKKGKTLTEEMLEKNVIICRIASTYMENRNDRIERIKVGDEVKIEFEKNEDFKMVSNDEGYLGEISSTIMDLLSALIEKKGFIIIKTIIKEVTPLSKFAGTRKRSSEVLVEIQYEVSEDINKIIQDLLDNTNLFFKDNLLYDIPEIILKKFGFLKEIDRLKEKEKEK